MIEDIKRDLWDLPGNERGQFARAIARRAELWRAQGEDDYPSPWPIVVRVEQDPLV